MSGIEHIGKSLLIIGLVICAAGLLLMFAGKMPWIGKLPGDILIQKKNFTFYLPIATSIILSIILTLIFFILGRR
ncbi:MAG TPA: DUF2905 domain-containing protein [Dissulfurispiraceae bacterium]|nr:DUF2905 domain-containing protein [Dissulfurispiraceae bacterium]